MFPRTARHRLGVRTAADVTRSREAPDGGLALGAALGLLAWALVAIALKLAS